MAVPKKYEHIDFTPPEGVANAAAKGLELRQKASPSNRGGLTPAEASKEGIGSGVQRAVNLKNRDNVSPKVIKQMRGFLSRSEKSSKISPENKDKPWNDKGYVAWLLWGGDPAKAWTDKIIKQMEAADEKEKQSKQAALMERWGSMLVTAEENEPTNPKLWAKVQALAKGEQASMTHNGKTINGPNDGKGFTVFPSAYANGWASKVYGDLGGGWKKKASLTEAWGSRTARGKAKKDVGHGGLDEWFSGHGGAKGKGEDATWGDWVSISPVTKTLPSGKRVEKGEIVGECGISDDPDWKEVTKGGEDPLKCMPRQKAYDMPKAERAEKAKAKQEAEKADSSRGKKPTSTPTFDKNATSHKQGGVYKPMSEITPGTQDVLDTPTPAWLDREYPYVAPPGEGCTLRELDYLTSLIPLRAQWGSFIKAADEDMAGLFVTLCSELGAPCDRKALGTTAGQAAILITKMKWLYNRPRPYQIAAKHNRLAGQGRVMKPGDFWPMDTKAAHTPAYPSGHTIQAYLLASRLSEAAPQHRKAFMDLAHAISFSRAVGGYHWPSDLTFAKDVFRHIVSPRMPSSIRVASEHLRSKSACIIAAGQWDGHKCLFKNRDRNYTPKVKVYHVMKDDVEILYMKDEITGWCEGINSSGIGIVNSALAVAKDEKEKQLTEEDAEGATLRDGKRVLEALSKTSVEDAVESIKTFDEGLKGHTFVADTDQTVSLEATWEGHDYHVRQLANDKKHVRTNHGQFHQDAGYTEEDGDDYLSSLARRDQAMKAIRDVDTYDQIAPTIYGKRRKERSDPLNMVKLTDGMKSTSQVVLDLSELVVYLYLLPGQVEFLGYQNDLPKSRKPKLTLKVMRYTDLDDDGEFEIEEVDYNKSSKSASLPEIGNPMPTDKSKTRTPLAERWGSTLYEFGASIPGGVAEGMSPSDFDPEELDAGIEVEHEHLVNDGYSESEMDSLAQDIAMDHLSEIPDYYTRLKLMESEAGMKSAKEIKSIWLVTDPGPHSEIVDVLVELSDWGTLRDIMVGMNDWHRSNPKFHDDEKSALSDAEKRLQKLHGKEIPEWVMESAQHGFKMARVRRLQSKREAAAKLRSEWGLESD